jgi:RNA polymerase sigma factor (sigma-70 family)
MRWVGFRVSGRHHLRCRRGVISLVQTGTVSTAGTPSDAETYRLHANELTRFATVLVGAFDAQDVVSNAFVRCLSSTGWRDVQDRRAYLYKAVANEAKNLKRSAARRRVREEAAPADPHVEPPSPRPDVIAAIEGLSVRQRAVVYLAYWEDMTDQMIANHLGIGAGSVRRHLARARSKLREVLDE